MTARDVQFGQIDVYLFDQLLRGRLKPPMRVLDAGCGGGRNLVYLLRSGFDGFGVVLGGAAGGALRMRGAPLAPHLPGANFRVERVEEMSFPDAFADAVLSSAVLHFARDDRHFEAML